MKGKLEELSIDDLTRSLKETKEDLRKERFSGVTSRIENTKKIKERKKHIARILTLLREYELGIRMLKVK